MWSLNITVQYLVILIDLLLLREKGGSTMTGESTTTFLYDLH